jgi:hypothetical protein
MSVELRGVPRPVMRCGWSLSWFYVSQPQLIVVIGHPSDAGDDEEVEQRQAEVRRIVQRIRSLLLPAGVMGIWTDERGALQDILEPADSDEREPAELQPVH